MSYPIPSLSEIQTRLLVPLPTVDATDTAAEWLLDNSTPIPPQIAELHARRVATREHFANFTTPQPGQMRLCPSEQLDWPLAVLLWRPMPSGNWEGWLMASETDYATPMDVLLDTEDEPYDPLLAMVQLWNRVEVRIAPEQRVLGQLSPARLEVLAHAAQTPAMVPDTVSAEPGTVIERLVADRHLVLCGTPLGDATDPRHDYQQLYRQAAARIAAPARQAATVESWWQVLVERLHEVAADWALAPLTPLLPVAPMREPCAADGALADGYEIAGLLRVESLPSDSQGALTLKVTHIGSDPLQLRLLLHDTVLAQHRLNKPGEHATLFITPEPGLALEITAASGAMQRWVLEA